MKGGVRLAKLDDGTFVCTILGGSPANPIPMAQKGLMSREEATAWMRDMYVATGAGKETAAYHGIDVTA